MNVTQFVRLYRRRVHGAGVTGSDVHLDLDRVDPGWIRVLSHVSVENQTSAYTKCRLVIRSGPIDLPVDEAIYPDEDELLVYNHKALLGEGDMLRATLTGTTTGDVLELVAAGWEMKRED